MTEAPRWDLGPSRRAEAEDPAKNGQPQANSPCGILTRIAAAERGSIALPVLTPHLEFRPIEDGQVLLVSESFNTLLRGKVHCDILPLLDGRRPQDEIIAALANRHSTADVHRALAALAARGYVVSGGYEMERGWAAYWSALGASPRWAEERLASSRVAIAGDDGRLARRLDALDVAVGAENPSLSVVVCADYFDEGHDSLNRRHISSGAPWMLLRPKGMHPLFGPVFRPAEHGPCWTCLAHRLRGHQEVHTFLRNRGGEDAAFLPNAAAPAVLDAVLGLATAEIAKWLVFGDAAPLHERAISLDVARLKSEHHPTMCRPQCPACGDEALYRPDRPARPVRLQSSQKSLRNSGGVRAVSPEETLARYRHLISPVSGIVTWVARTADEADPWLHVHWAGSNLALRIKSLSSLRRSLRSKSAGKGSTAGQSEASALCEAIERYSSAFHGDEIRCRRRLADFVDAGEAEAIHPNDVQLFSDRQLDHAGEINARGHPYNVVPPRFDPEKNIDWSPVWSLTQGRRRGARCSARVRLHAVPFGKARRRNDYPGGCDGRSVCKALPRAAYGCAACHRRGRCGGAEPGRGHRRGCPRLWPWRGGLVRRHAASRRNSDTPSGRAGAGPCRSGCTAHSRYVRRGAGAGACGHSPVRSRGPLAA